MHSHESLVSLLKNIHFDSKNNASQDYDIFVYPAKPSISGGDSNTSIISGSVYFEILNHQDISSVLLFSRIY